MKRFYPFALIVLLPSCEAFQQAAQKPDVQQHFQKAAEEFASGNMPGASIAGISGLVTLVTYGIGKWFYGRLKKSPEGQILA